MAFSFSAIAGTPKAKGDAKAKVEATTETATATVAADEAMYWFPTKDNGNELLDPAGIPLSQTPSVNKPCDGTSSNYCAKGFLPADTHISEGKRLPTPPVSSGAPAKKT